MQDSIERFASSIRNSQMLRLLLVGFLALLLQIPISRIAGLVSERRARRETRHAIFLSERLHIRGSIDSEIRHRGIFAVPVYQLGLTVEGEFARPDASPCFTSTCTFFSSTRTMPSSLDRLDSSQLLPPSCTPRGV